jgi:hypothetical protein
LLISESAGRSENQSWPASSARRTARSGGAAL